VFSAAKPMLHARLRLSFPTAFFTAATDRPVSFRLVFAGYATAATNLLSRFRH
jgi:hypothetical protein